jgi:hypothetical protein
MADVRYMTYGPLVEDRGYGIVYYVPQTVSPSMSYMMIL